MSLAIIVTVMTLLNGFNATYQVQREQLIKQTLETNQAYALKIAAATNGFIYAAQQQLAISAELIASNFDDNAFMFSETKRLRLQTNSFNAVTIVNKDGVALAGSPLNDRITDKKLTTKGIVQALKAKKPMVSTPYISTLGNLMTLVSYPILDHSGEYLGFVGGAIYLNDRSILNDLLSVHFHEDGSYIYVVDKNKQLIYHPDPERVGTYPIGDIATHAVLHSKSGSIQAYNSLGIEMLAGFATIESVNWGVVAQRPVEATLSELDSLMKQVIYRMLPLAFFTLIVIWIVASLISRPLRRLADTAKHLNDPSAFDELSNTRSWYFESNQLKKAMLKGLGLLNIQINQLQQDAATDPLTGALNRRSLQILLENLAEQKIPYAVLVIDIDHFKQVNDTFGHAAGDKALIRLTETLYEVSREQDIVSRTGGEEFLLVLPNTPIDIALKIAERLRASVAALEIAPIGSITVSIGIAACVENKLTPDEVIHLADQALYQAKRLGRNRCEVFTPEN